MAKVDSTALDKLSPIGIFRPHHYRVIVYNHDQTEVRHTCTFLDYSSVLVHLNNYVKLNLLTEMDEWGFEHTILDPITYEVIGWVTIELVSPELMYHARISHYLNNKLQSSTTHSPMPLKEAELFVMSYLMDFPDTPVTPGAMGNSWLLQHSENEFTIIKYEEANCSYE